MDQLARRVLEGAAAGSVPRAHLEELARAVLEARPVRLAREVLKGGEWQLAAGLELAGTVLRRAGSAVEVEPVPGRPPLEQPGIPLRGAVGAKRQR